MDSSMFLAQLFGLLYFVMGIGMLTNQAQFKKVFTDMTTSATFQYLCGMIAVVSGFAIVTFHNIWVRDWVVLVTLMGWASLIKGVLLLVAPGMIVSKAKFWMNRMQLCAVCVLILGLVLGYFGFIA